VKSIIFVLGSAFACASLIVAFAIYQFGPSGRYIAGNTLLSPQAIEQINQQSQGGKKKQGIFVFNPIDFSYFDEQQRQQRHQTVPIEQYQKFYALIASEKSLDQTQELSHLFIGVHPTILTMTMHDTQQPNSTQTFQMVQFKDNYFRVQLREGDNKGEWAYFYFPDLSRQILRLFAQSS